MLNFLSLHKEKHNQKRRTYLAAVLLLFALGAFVFMQQGIANVWRVPAPTVVFPQDRQEMVVGDVMITGNMKNGTTVDVYIDGNYHGEAVLKEDESGTGSFAFQKDLELTPGTHIVYTVAKNKSDQRKSTQSPVIRFLVKHPAPTLFAPVVNQHTTEKQPYIIGVAKNNSKIGIYINDMLDGVFTVDNHASGTAHFAYMLNTVLPEGPHDITARLLLDEKEIATSNKVRYTVGKTFPAPTILATYPKLKGLAKNNSTVQLFLDNKLFQEFRVKDHASGTANFIFDTSHLKPGAHSLRTRAISPEGFMSNVTQPHIFHVGGHAKGTTPSKAVPSQPTQTPVIEPACDVPAEGGSDVCNVPMDDTQAPTNTTPVEEHVHDDQAHEENPSIASQVNFDEEEPQDHSLTILLILTILVTIFLIWFIWTNRQFFKRQEPGTEESPTPNPEPWTPRPAQDSEQQKPPKVSELKEKKNKQEEDDEDVPSLF